MESLLCHWRDAERLLGLAVGRDAELIEREVARYRSLYQDLTEARADAATARLGKLKGHRTWFPRTLSTGGFE